MMHKRKMYVSPIAKVVVVKMKRHLLTVSGTRDSYGSGGDAWSETGTGASRSSYQSGGDVWE